MLNDSVAEFSLENAATVLHGEIFYVAFKKVLIKFPS